MTISRFGIYLAEAGFAGIVFAVVGAAGRAIWDSRRGRQ